MRKPLIALAAIAALGATQARAAEGGSEHPFKLGVGLGWSTPIGEVAKGEDMNKLYQSEIPIEVEATYKLTHEFSLGVYGGYGYGIVTKNGRVDADVYTRDVVSYISTWRFGLQAEYEFEKAGGGNPYVAARTGYFTETAKGKNGNADASANGWEYLTAIVGIDFPVSGSFDVGPFLSGSIGEYTNVKDQSVPDDQKAFHYWITIGVRGTWGL